MDDIFLKSGNMHLFEGPGIGVELKEDMMEKFGISSREFRI